MSRMYNFTQLIENANSIGISGHIRPDGDCTGSCLGLFRYLQENFGQKQIDLYLEPFSEEFNFLADSQKVKHEVPEKKEYDLYISLDCGSPDRLGMAEALFYQAKSTVNIDHHISNTCFGDFNLVEAFKSSTCEVLFGLMEPEKISKETAEALYLGIVHDTGVFKHSCTGEDTMRIAGKLISLGARPEYIIDHTFYEKTYLQNQILGRCLLESFLVLEGKVILSCVDRKTMEFYGAKSLDFDGVIDQLRVTKGVEVAVFAYETDTQEYKVSMRSNGEVNVSKIAVFFGGGGHVKAAGCTLKGSRHDVMSNIIAHIDNQLKQILPG